MVVGIQACRQLVVGTQACRQLAVGIQACMALVVGTQVRIQARMAVVRKQARMVAHIRVGYCSSDCWSIPPIGVPSCIEEATRRKFLVVFSL